MRSPHGVLALTVVDARSRSLRAASTSGSKMPSSLAAWKSRAKEQPRLRSTKLKHLLNIARERCTWKSDVTTASLLHARANLLLRRMEQGMELEGLG